MSKRHLLLSIAIHTIVILFLIYFPWHIIKKNNIETIELINLESFPQNSTPPTEIKKEEPIQQPIPEPKKEEIPVPVKKTERKIVPKPEIKEKPKKVIPPPKKIESNLKDKLKDLKETPNEEVKEEPKNDDLNTDDLKKNPQFGQDSVN